MPVFPAIRFLMRVKIRRTWVWGLLFALAITSLLFNSGFKNTLARKKAIRQAERDLKTLTVEIESMKSRISRLENNPQAYEQLVRRELGYIRPGEKEVRF